MGVGVVIATCDRPGPLKATLESLAAQTLPPEAIVVVDSSPDRRTERVVSQFMREFSVDVAYQRSGRQSAASQRNQGAGSVASDIILFLDDDLMVQTSFVEEITRVFCEDVQETVGGVSGTISNQTFSRPRPLNRWLLRIVTGWFKGDFAGRLVGPGVNFLPEDGSNQTQEVDWLPSTCVAYRRVAFEKERFCDGFDGYSYAEDVHLSARVAKRYRLLNTTRARVYHFDLGRDTHKNWTGLGNSMVRNRHLIMTDVMGKSSFGDEFRLFAYEIVYCSLALAASDCSWSGLKRLGGLMRGKFGGFWEVWFEDSDSRLKRS